MTLVELLNAIRKYLYTKIKTDLGDSIKFIFVGKKIKIGDLSFPMIWVMPIDSNITDEGMAIHEEWILEYWVVSLVRSDRDPEAARDLAEQLAINASAALITDYTGKENRTLNGLVSYTKRVGFAPSDDRVLDADESLYGAGVRIRIRFENEEVK